MVLNKKTKGFTLIEMMVAVTIFTIVALMVSTIFVTMANAYRHAQAMKIVMDNLNFAMDTMVLDLKNGYSYECKSSVNNECVSLSFRSLIDDNPVVYSFKDNSLMLDNSSLTSPEIEVNNLFFRIQGLPSQDQKVSIVINGSATTILGDETEFSLQTVVASRVPSID